MRLLQAFRFVGWVFIVVGTVSAGSAQELDVLIRGGRVVDGTGNPWMRADVGVRGDRIERIGDLSDVTARVEIDATGLVVSPGFVDPHTHAIRGIFRVPTADNALLQGVTTLTEGNDGSSPLPIGEHLAQMAETEISPNWAIFVGHGTVRTSVMGREDRPPTATELDEMRALVATAMEEGALGLSTGLFYVPGIFSDTEEVIALAAVAGRHGGMYISHMRDEAAGLLDSVRETIRIGEEAGLPVQMTHHKALGRHGWGLSQDSLAMVDVARGRGIDVTIDQYPYTASQTSITALFPPWALEGERQDVLDRIRDPETRRRLRGDIVWRIVNDRGGDDPSNVVVSRCEWDPSLEGQSLADILEGPGRRGHRGGCGGPGDGARRAGRGPCRLSRNAGGRRRAHHAASGDGDRVRRRRVSPG